MIIEPGAVFTGDARIDGGLQSNWAFTSTLEFAGGPGLNDFMTSFADFNSIIFDPGAHWAISNSAANLEQPVITGFATGDVIEVDGFAATGHKYLGGVLTLSNDASVTVTLQLPGNFTDRSFTVETEPDGSTDIAIACYARGTRIATENGEAPVEKLRAGDHVRMTGGSHRPIRWVGTRSYDGRFIAGNRSVLPIPPSAWRCYERLRPGTSSGEAERNTESKISFLKKRN